MLDAQARGRGRFATYEAGMELATQRRAHLDHALREAVERGSFQVRYQPQLDFAGRMVGAEVLVRWHHPVHGEVSPVEFIPIAEQTGLIHGVGEWVRAQACRQLAAPVPSPRPLWRLAVNLSPWELVRPSFPERVERLLGETGADPLRLMFELTEGVMLHRLEQVIENMSRLRALGVRFSIDDFGTGYSSLAYLRQLPLDQLKIDKVFVAGLEHPGNRALVRSIAEIGAALGLEVVAEGIETEMQRELLFGLGCNAVQGFLLAKPMAEPEFLAFASRRESALPVVSGIEDAIIPP
jgi:EAL domain-containing protein (putative c-di-GMP-specific phosphodiesterase class I)